MHFVVVDGYVINGRLIYGDFANTYQYLESAQKPKMASF
jgi:hypothetical protein